MNVFESLRVLFKNLFSGKRTGQKIDRAATEVETDKAGPGGMATRCVNPDIGCPVQFS